MGKIEDMDQLHRQSKRMRSAPPQKPPRRLRQVVYLVGKKGMSNAEAADELGLKYYTVCEHLKRARDKAGLTGFSPREAARYLSAARPNLYDWVE
jgi:DNA-binding NarL/FixJ family response regulator